MRSQRVRHKWKTFTFTSLRKNIWNLHHRQNINFLKTYNAPLESERSNKYHRISFLTKIPNQLVIDMGIGKWGFQNQLYYWQSFFKIFFKLILFTCSLARYHTACGILAPQPGIWTHAPCIGCADGSPGKSPDRAFGEHGLGMQTIGLLMPDPGVKQISSQITDSFGNPQASPGQSRAFVTKLTAEPKATRSTCVLQVSWSQRAGREASPPPSSSQTHQPDNLLLFSAVEMSGGDGGQKEDKTYIYWCPWTQKYKAWRREINPPLSFSSVAQSCPTLGPHGLQHSRPPCLSQLPEFTQTHVHGVGDAIQPSHPLSSPSPPALSLSQHQGLFKSVSSSHQVAKVLEFQL